MAPLSFAIDRLRHDNLSHLPFNPPLQQLAPLAPRRRRLLPLPILLRCFLMQILSGNVAIAALRQLTGIDFAPSSYCQARARLPLSLLENLLRWLTDQAIDAAQRIAVTSQLIGAATQRVLIVDGSTFSMSDTPALLEHFGRPSGQKPGVGYPCAKLMGTLDPRCSHRHVH